MSLPLPAFKTVDEINTYTISKANDAIISNGLLNKHTTAKNPIVRVDKDDVAYPLFTSCYYNIIQSNNLSTGPKNDCPSGWKLTSRVEDVV